MSNSNVSFNLQEYLEQMETRIRSDVRDVRDTVKIQNSRIYKVEKAHERTDRRHRLENKIIWLIGVTGLGAILAKLGLPPLQFP